MIIIIRCSLLRWRFHSILSQKRTFRRISNNRTKTKRLRERSTQEDRMLYPIVSTFFFVLLECLLHLLNCTSLFFSMMMMLIFWSTLFFRSFQQEGGITSRSPFVHLQPCLQRWHVYSSRVCSLTCQLEFEILVLSLRFQEGKDSTESPECSWEFPMDLQVISIKRRLHKRVRKISST